MNYHKKRRRDSTHSKCHCPPLATREPCFGPELLTRSTVLAMESRGTDDRHVFTVVWKIENIGLLKSACAWWGAGSPVFIVRTLEKKELFLELYPNSEMGTIQIYLTLSGNPLNFPIDCEWSFIGCNGSPLVSGTMRDHRVKEREPFNMSGCPTHEEVFVNRKSDFLLNNTLTVRLRIWRSHGNLSADEFVSCRTRCEATNYSFLWPIQGFSNLQWNQEVTTPITLDSVTGKFLLKFSFRGAFLGESHATVELFPLLISSNLLVKLKVSLLDRKRNVHKILVTESKCFLLNKKDTWILPKVISREELLKVKSDCLRNDVLTMLCEITTERFSDSIEEYYYGCLNLKLDNTKESIMFLDASCQTSENNVDTSENNVVTSETNVDASESSRQRRDTLGSLGEDLLTLYREQGLTDFDLRSGDVVFKVHKNILSARSPVFKAMFSSEMMEAPFSYRDVSDIDVLTLTRTLNFLYGDTVEPDLQLESAAKLYYAADKYQIKSLKQQCSLIIRSSIQVSNVSDILTLADRHQDSELMSFVDEFFLNNFDEIVQSEGWRTFQEHNPALAGKTVLRVYQKKLISKLP